MNQDQNLASYMDRRRRIRDNLHSSTVCMPVEPPVKAAEKILDIPDSVWDTDQYGRLDDLIEYMQSANHIPRNAGLEVQFDDPTRVFRLRFYWWEVVIISERGVSML